MNTPRASAEDYIQFAITSPKVASATEAARVQPDRPADAAHDAFTSLLRRLEPDPVEGVLDLDDSTLDKPA